MSKDTVIQMIERSKSNISDLTEIRKALDAQVESIKAEFKKLTADYKSNGRKRRPSESENDASTAENAHD